MRQFPVTLRDERGNQMTLHIEAADWESAARKCETSTWRAVRRSA